MQEQLSIPVSDLYRSQRFYQQALKPLGYEQIKDMKFAVSFSVLGGYGLVADSGVEFWLFQGEVSTRPAAQVVFGVSSKAVVDAFFSAALAAGGQDKGKPGVQTSRHPDEYAAFVCDPDGYTVAVVCCQAAMA
ncbi:MULTISPECIES: VOC family protein [Dickeya]|uniref:Lactoylglutathione lyase and related lyases n=1 Tax=Dickeya aquatica TaxID=1401087 RepID=A0A375A7Z5_9GAMM|nr:MULTISPECIES: glyoxalase [Dickeya]SLM62140.1 Lactoylglutathione lyase and related lyases [Dickeya aquatica]